MSYLCACDHATLSTGLALFEYPSAGVQAFVQRIKRELGSWMLLEPFFLLLAIFVDLELLLTVY